MRAISKLETSRCVGQHHFTKKLIWAYGQELIDKLTQQDIYDLYDLYEPSLSLKEMQEIDKKYTRNAYRDFLKDKTELVEKCRPLLLKLVLLDWDASSEEIVRIGAVKYCEDQGIPPDSISNEEILARYLISDIDSITYGTSRSKMLDKFLVIVFRFQVG